MERIKVTYKIAVEVEEEVEITDEEYITLINYAGGADTFLSLEERVTKKFRNYVKESFETMGITY